MEINKLNEIIDKRREELKDKNYNYSFYTRINCCWNKLLKYLKENNLTYNTESKKGFLKLQEELTRKKDFYYVKYAIEAIDDIENAKSNKSGYAIKLEKTYNHSKINNALIDKYLNEISEYSSKSTYSQKKKYIHRIISHFESLNVMDISKISKEYILDYNNYCLKFDNYSIKKCYKWIFKDFILFMYNNNIIDKNYSLLLDKIKTPIKKLPTTWNKEELKKIVDNLDDSTGINSRNKAMALIAIRLGIRFIDIKNLKFENINWKENKICFTQIKTNKYLEVPLIEDVGNAIINYVNNYRPKSDLPYIFITHDSYVKKLSDQFSIREYLIDTYKKAKIDYLSKNKKGIHSFRHALASNMLSSGIPLSIISSTLGHSNTNSTKVYFSISYDLLRKCCLDVPEGLDE